SRYTTICSSTRRPLPHLARLLPYTTLFRSCVTLLSISTSICCPGTDTTPGIFSISPKGKPSKLNNRLPMCLPLSINTCIVLVLRSEEHTSELQSRFDLVCRLLLEKIDQPST